MPQNQTVFSLRLRYYREAAGLTQEETAAYLAVCRSTYSYYELGKTEPGIETLKRIARLFRVPVKILIAEDELNTE